MSETDHQQYRIVGDYHVNMAFPDACLCCHDALLGTILIDGVCFRCWVEQEIKPLRAEHRTLVEAARNVDAAFRKHRECNQLPQELYDALNEMRHMMEDAPASKSQAKRLAIQKGGE